MAGLEQETKQTEEERKTREEEAERRRQLEEQQKNALKSAEQVLNPAPEKKEQIEEALKTVDPKVLATVVVRNKFPTGNLSLEDLDVAGDDAVTCLRNYGLSEEACDQIRQAIQSLKDELVERGVSFETIEGEITLDRENRAKESTEQELEKEKQEQLIITEVLREQSDYCMKIAKIYVDSLNASLNAEEKINSTVAVDAFLETCRALNFSERFCAQTEQALQELKNKGRIDKEEYSEHFAKTLGTFAFEKKDILKIYSLLRCGPSGRLDGTEGGKYYFC